MSFLSAILPVVFGGLATLAFGPIGLGLVGGGTAFLLGAAAGSVFGGLFLGVDVPDAPTSAGRALENAADPEYPRRAIYGRRLVGSSWLWDGAGEPSGVYDNDSHYYLSSAIADHRIQGIVGVKLGDDMHPIGSGSLMEEVTAGYSFPGDRWLLPTNAAVYVPTDASKYKAFYQGERDGPKVWHYAIRIFRGVQTAPDSAWFGNTTYLGAQATKYSDNNRVLRGITYVNEAFVVNSELGFGGSIPQRQYLVDGKDDIFDWRDSTSKFTKNAVLIAADYLKWRLGFTNANFDSANMIAMADACDQTIPGRTIAKYTFDGVISWDEDPGQALNMLCEHFRGGHFQRGSKTIFWVGVPRSSVMTLTPADLVEGSEPVFSMELPPEDRANTIVPHFIQSVNADGDHVWASRPGLAFTDAAWKTADNGAELRKDIHLQGVTGGVRAQYHAAVVANQGRLEFQVSGAFRMRALVLETGDVVRWTDPEVGLDEFMWVTKAAHNFERHYVALTLREWDSEMYQKSPIDDDDLGRFPTAYSVSVPQVTGLTATMIPGSSSVQADGTSWVKVALTWNEVNRIWVSTGGAFVIQYRKANSSSWKGINVDGNLTGVELNLGPTTWEFQVRARDAFGNIGRWSTTTSLVVTRAGDSEMDGAPIDANQPENVLTNPRFSQKDLGYNIVDVDHLGTGSLTWRTPTGSVDAAFSEWEVFMVADGPGGAPDSDYHIRIDHQSKYRARVQEGEFYRLTAAYVPLVADKTAQLGCLMYDEDNAFQQFTVVATKTSPLAETTRLQSLSGYVQIPWGLNVRRAALEFLAKFGPTFPNQVGLRFVAMAPVKEWPVTEGQDNLNVTSSWTIVGNMSGVWFRAPAPGKSYRVRFDGSYVVTGIPVANADLMLRIVRVDQPGSTQAAPINAVEVAASKSIRTIIGSGSSGVITGTRESIRRVAVDIPPVDNGQEYAYWAMARTDNINAVVDFLDCGMTIIQE